MNDRDQVKELLSLVSRELADALEKGAITRSACTMARRTLMDAWLLLSEDEASPMDERKALLLARSMDGLLAGSGGDPAPDGSRTGPLVERFQADDGLRTAADGILVARLDRIEKSVGDLLRRTRSMVNKAEKSAGIAVASAPGNTETAGDAGGTTDFELVRGDAQE